ncbi:MAG: hypothetical protein WBQ26_05740 [Gemmatimonadaceae bacterium]
MAASFDGVGRAVRPAYGLAAVAALALVGWGKPGRARAGMPTGPSMFAPSSLDPREGPTVSKVPFGNKYMTDDEHRVNRDANQSTSHHAPADLPGAFHDEQGGLWFAKNGYYVVVSGANAFKEPAARVLAGKL